MTGALPPSSRCVRLIDFDAACSTFWPVAIEPVSDSMWTPSWLISALPVVWPRPLTTLKTPSGKISATSRPSFSVVSGVISDGFSTIVLPAISAGPIFHTAIISG